MYSILEKEGDNGPLFTFKTKHGLNFYVSFHKYDGFSYPLDNLYSLDFGEEDRSKSPNDPLISSTILEIIITFINRDNSIVLQFICDSVDRKHLFRAKLFSRWFAISEPANLIKYDLELEGYPDYKLSFIYNSSVYSVELIEEEVLLYLDSLEREKGNVD